MPRSAKSAVPPSETPEKAIELLIRYVAEADQIAQLDHSDGRVDAWEEKCTDLLDRAFGRPDGGEYDPKTSKFRYLSRGSYYVNMPQQAFQANRIAEKLAQKQLLEGYIEIFRDRTSPPVMAAGLYRLHPEIEAASAGLFRSGHYRQAVLDAQICVLNALKAKSGLHDLDGSQLADRALTPRRDDAPPIVQINGLSNQAERDEQQGFFFLFKGLAMLRNFKAHTTVPLDSADRATEYLSLCSLLHRVIDEAAVNP